MRKSIGIHARAVFVAAGISMAGSPLFAHHGWSGYDASRALELKGKIIESGYEHPHGFIRLETDSKTWLVVLAPPSRMERRSLPSKLLAPGTEATVVGYPSRTDSIELRAERIRIGGRTTELR
jgi:Family of unknown function (DUF6152)